MHSISLLPFLLSGLVAAQGGGVDKGEGHYITTVGRNVFDDDKYREKDIACDGIIEIRGLNNGFDIDCSNLNLYNYQFTGAPNGGQMFNKPTTVFTSRTMDLTAAQIGRPRIDELRMDKGALVITFAAGNGGKVKYQAKDNTQGGMLQIETEYGVNITHTINLAPGIFYFINPNMDNAVRVGNGIPADNTHTDFVAKDSPQGANRLFQDGFSSKWNVWSGGRMGAVFGEDALEDAPPATVCTSDCQAQNQVRGSLPVTELPDFIVPIGAEDEDDD